MEVFKALVPPKVGDVVPLIRCTPGTVFQDAEPSEVQETGTLLMVNNCRARVYWHKRVPWRSNQEYDCQPYLVVRILEIGSQDFNRDNWREQQQATKPVKVMKEKVVKPPSQRDKFGQRVGTKCAAINAVLTGKWQSTAAIAKASGCAESLVFAHCSTLARKQLVLIDRTKREAKLKSDVKVGPDVTEVPQQTGYKINRKRPQLTEPAPYKIKRKVQGYKIKRRKS